MKGKNKKPLHIWQCTQNKCEKSPPTENNSTYTNNITAAQKKKQIQMRDADIRGGELDRGKLLQEGIPRDITSHHPNRITYYPEGNNGKVTNVENTTPTQCKMRYDMPVRTQNTTTKHTSMG